MALISCPECKKEISDTSKKCIHCGYKLRKNRKNVKLTILALAVAAVVVTGTVLILTNLSVSPAEKTAKQFLESFKQENFYEMSRVSSISSSELIDDYVGVNVINYSIKSIDEMPLKYHVIETDGDLRSLYEEMYPDYEVLFESTNCYRIQSPKPVLHETIISIDMEYSNYVGDTKRNSVTLTLTETEPNTNEYEVTQILGINNSLF